MVAQALHYGLAINVMHKYDDVTQLVVACMFNVATKEDLESWLDTFIKSCDSTDPEIFDIYCHDVAKERARFVDYFQKVHPKFEIGSAEGIRACKTVLLHQIQLLQIREIAPSSFCRFIFELETSLLDNAIPVEGVIPYPDFLGDLWNACDWCDASWTLDNSDYLRDESKRVAEALEKGTNIKF